MTLTLFRYKDQPADVQTLDLSDATTITGYKSLMWIERYRDPGEFTIVAPVSSGLRSKLPLGTFISHTGTQELMIVESHEIKDNDNGEAEITVTGRSFETWLENRIITYYGTNASGPQVPIITVAKSFYFTVGYTAANCAVVLIDWHCYGTTLDGHLTNLRTINTSAGGTVSTREIGVVDLHKAVLDLLAIDDLGIQSVRPGPTSGLPNATDVGFIIHNGIDRSSDVVFSHDSGDLRNGQYLWTLKNQKNHVMIQGTSVRTTANTTPKPKGYDMRVGYVDAGNLGTTTTDEATALVDLGNGYLAKHRERAIIRVDVAPNANRFRYKTDYNVGDLVGVSGNYDTSGVMRVTEHVEILDETGHSSYPTLEAV